jgi:hypothetical protein
VEQDDGRLGERVSDLRERIAKLEGLLPGQLEKVEYASRDYADRKVKRWVSAAAAAVLFISTIGMIGVTKDVIRETVHDITDTDAYAAAVKRVNDVADTMTTYVTNASQANNEIEQLLGENRAYGFAAGNSGGDWRATDDGSGIYIFVNTEKYGFRKTPVYLCAVYDEDNKGGQWGLSGERAIYEASPFGFKVYLRHINGGKVTVADAKKNGWHVRWIAVFERN